MSGGRISDDTDQKVCADYIAGMNSSEVARKHGISNRPLGTFLSGTEYRLEPLRSGMPNETKQSLNVIETVLVSGRLPNALGCHEPRSARSSNDMACEPGSGSRKKRRTKPSRST